MSHEHIEASVKSCYSTWGQTYYDEYYGDKASYPPVHKELVRQELLKAGAITVLDAGCGPASMLRDLAGDGFDLYGFDLTPEMVTEAKRVLDERGIPADHIWEGSVLAADAFRGPGPGAPRQFDAAICFGVFPHIPAETDAIVLRHLRDAVKPGGLVAVEARNQLFALFTLNRYSHELFFDELIRAQPLKQRAGDDLTALEKGLHELRTRFRMDLPSVRTGNADEPGYDEVLSRTHNPLVMTQQMQQAGFADVQMLFYHFHCLPPMLQGFVPQLFVKESVAMEDPTDWRGYFMASAFVVTGKRT